MEPENVFTFRKNVEELGRSESYPNLSEYVKIVGPKTIEWKQNVSKKVKDLVEYFASRYLV